MINISTEARLPKRLIALAAGVVAFLCIAAPSAQALEQIVYKNSGFGPYGEQIGYHSRHIVGNMVVYEGSGNVTVCEGARYSNSFNVVRQSCGVGGSGNALNMHLYYDGSWMSPFVRNPNNYSIGKTIGRQYEDWAAMWGGEKRHQVSHLTSRNGKYRATIQLDGNFVVYNNHTGKACWWTGTNGWVNSYVAMQSDGNLVVYRDDGKWLWQSGTNGNPGSFLLMQDDGNLVVYNSAKQPLWWSGSQGCQ